MHIGLMAPINNTTMEKEPLEWLPGVNQCVTLRIPKLKTLLNQSGIQIRRLNSFQVSNVDELSTIDPTAVAARAWETMENNCDALFIACSQLPTYPIIRELEAAFRRPVWSSMKATARRVCQTYGLLFPTSREG